MERDAEYMKEAILLAKKALEFGEVPVGAVAVWDGEIVGRGYNCRESQKNALYHAEIMAIDEACKKLGGWRLHKCDLYVTLEPCAMCAGAIINARIKRVVFGASDSKAGSFGSVLNLNDYPYNHKPVIEKGLMEQETSELLSAFFTMLREKKRSKE